jgi:hypothetical protein
MDGFVPPRCLTLDLLRDTTDNGFVLVNVDPKNDYAFKAVVGSPRHRRVLIHLLNAILGPYGLLRTGFSDPNRLEFDVRQNGERELNWQKWGKAQKKEHGRWDAARVVRSVY